MDLAAGVHEATQGPPPAETCPRCGTFAALERRLGRELCAECWGRVAEASVTAARVLSDVQRLASRLLLRSWFALAVIELPLTIGRALYTFGTGKSLPMQVDNLYFLVTLIAVGAILHASHQVLMGDARIDWQAARRAGWQRWGALVGVSWASGLLTLVFLLLLVVPGILRALSYALVTAIALHERWDTSETLAQSTARTRGQRFPILVAAIATFALGFVPAILLAVGVGALVGVASDAEPGVYADALIELVSSLVMYVPLALLYFMVASLYVRCSVTRDKAAKHEA
jgi:hypothetical protein